MALPTYHIEFVGGPFDGHIRDVWVSPEELQAFVSLPVSVRAVRSAENKHPPAEPRATSIAHYELLNQAGAWRYQFLGSSRPPTDARAGLLARLMDRIKALGRGAYRAWPSLPRSGNRMPSAAS